MKNLLVFINRVGNESRGTFEHYTIIKFFYSVIFSKRDTKEFSRRSIGLKLRLLEEKKLHEKRFAGDTIARLS